MTEEDATARDADPEAAATSPEDGSAGSADGTAPPDEDAVESDAEAGESADDAAASERGEAPSAHDELVARVAAVDDELAVEVADLAERAADLADERDRLSAALEDRESEVEDLTGRLQRTQADFQNYKKRAKKRREQVEERATRDLVERLLEVRDDLGRALADESGDVEALREGVALTVEEFDRVLADEDVAEIAPAPGDEVDPNRHEVMLRVDSDHPEGTVAEVYRPGYEMTGTVLRPAQVTVSDGSGDDGSEAGEEPASSDDGDAGADAEAGGRSDV